MPTTESVSFTLTHPMRISSRLLPAVQVADGWVSVELIGQEQGGRLHWRFYIDSPAGTYKSDDGVTLAPIGGDTWGSLAARAVAVICDDLGSEECPCAWLPDEINAWRREHLDDFSVMREELGGE